MRDIKGLDAESADKIIAALTSGDLDALSEAICEAIEKNPDALAELGGSVKKEQIAKTIEKSTLPAYLEKRATEYAEYIAGGAEPQPITSDEIHGLLEENIVVVEQEFNVTISKADREELKKVVDEQAETIEKITDMSKVSETEYGDVIKLLRGFASPVTMWVLIIVDVVLLALLVIINRKAFPALLCGGISLTLSGLVFTIISFCSGLISGIVADSANLSASLINTVMSKVCGLIRMYGLPVLIVGFLMIIAALIVKIVTASKSPAPVPASAPDVFVPVAEEPVPEYAAQTVSETVSQPTHETLTPITEVISEPSETVTDSAAQTAETEKTE